MNRLKSYLWVVMLVLGLGAVIYLVRYGGEGVAALRKPVDLYAPDTEYQAITSLDLVYAEYDISMGCFAEVDSTATYYYAVPVFDGGETRWIGLAVTGEADARILDAITDETYAFLAGEKEDYGDTTISKYGTLKKMDEELYGFMQAAFKDLGVYDDEEMGQYVLPLYVSVYVPERAQKLFGGIVIVLVVSLVYLGAKLRSYLVRWRKNNPEETKID